MNAGRELDLFRSVNRAVGGSYIAVQLLSSSVAKRTIRDRRMTVQPPIGYRIVAGEQRGHRVSTRNLIAPRQIGDVSISLLLRPNWVMPGDDLPIHIGVFDQFNNQHRLKIRCRYAGPMPVRH